MSDEQTPSPRPPDVRPLDVRPLDVRSSAAPAPATSVGEGAWADLTRPPLRQVALARALTEGPSAAWRAVEVVPSTGSTNADLVARAQAGEPAGLVLATDHQSSGRGRLTRQWTAPPRSSLAVSVLIDPGVPQEHWGWIPLAAGVAVVQALTRVGGVRARLKWPNDVLVADPRTSGGALAGELRKVCGILAEVAHTPTGPLVVLGAGLNVTQTDDELPVPTAISLLTAGSATTDRDTLLRAYLRELGALLTAWRAAGGDPRVSGLAAAYREACDTIGRRVRVSLPGGPPCDGLADGVDDDGRLLVHDDEGRRHTFAAGDVEHVRPEPA